MVTFILVRHPVDDRKQTHWAKCVCPRVRGVGAEASGLGSSPRFATYKF